MKIWFNSVLKRNFMSKIRFVLTGTGISKQHSVSGLAGTGIMKKHSVSGYTGTGFWFFSGIRPENLFPVVPYPLIKRACAVSPPNVVWCPHPNCSHHQEGMCGAPPNIVWCPHSNCSPYTEGMWVSPLPVYIFLCGVHTPLSVILCLCHTRPCLGF